MVSSKAKGKAKATDSPSTSWDYDSQASNPPTSDENSDSEVDSPEYLESLLAQAKENAATRKRAKNSVSYAEEDLIKLDKDLADQPLPPLRSDVLSSLSVESMDLGIVSASVPDTERALLAASARSVPAPPIPPPEFSKSGKPLTRKEKKALKNKTAGPGWFDLPAPAEADIPRLYREVEALRLRNQLDPKRFYKKDEGEGKGIKGLPKYFAIGTVIPSTTPFGAGSRENGKRKRTIVDELVDDAEARSYAKKKFAELQMVRGAKGRKTLAMKQALRRRKW